MKTKKALIVVDLQNDFCPGGSLAVPEGDKIIPVINNLLPNYDLVIFTKDWHPANSETFASNHKDKQPFDKYTSNKGKEDILWPEHCVQNTPGADLHLDIDFGQIKGDFYIFKKGIEKNDHPYSGFEGTELKEFLKEREIEETHICGLALDYCVVATALDSVNYGFDTVVILDATKAISEDLNSTLEKFYNNNIKVVESWELPLFNIL